MCGIYAMLNAAVGPSDLAHAREGLGDMRHRGPDASNIVNGAGFVLAHNRLAIQGDHLLSAQPFVKGDRYLAVNGEIYNAETILAGTADAAMSDCEAVLRVLAQPAPFTAASAAQALQRLDGVYSLVHVNVATRQVLVARSRFGITPLYKGYDYGRGCIYFASERKAFPEAVTEVRQMPPGYLCLFPLLPPDEDYVGDGHVQTFRFAPLPGTSAGAGTSTGTSTGAVLDPVKFRSLLREAVRKRVDCIADGVEFGFLLSGGLDSSAVVALARELYPDRELRTFCIGLEGSPDSAAAQEVADFCKTTHTNYVFTVAEALAAYAHVVRAVETVDITSMRASTPMWLLARNIKRDFPALKVLLSGEGSDELLGGYLCFHQAPSLEASDAFSRQLLHHLHEFDVQRAHFSLMAHSIEARVPFLDGAFVDYVMGLHPVFRTPVCRQEKYWLRRAVANILPPAITARTKEQFSDGVGYEWIDTLKKASWRRLARTGEQLRAFRPEQDLTAEQLHIFDLFWAAFGPRHLEDICGATSNWRPMWSQSDDASGRVADMHPAAHAAP
jgi:asparagine synthase (glutamine-hydrolysing)